MTWLLLSFSTAFFESLRDVFNKKALKSHHEYTVALGLNLSTTIFLLPLLLAIEIPEIGRQFWLALAMGGSLNALAYIVFLKAIQSSELSKVAPLTTFTPLFLLLTSPVLVGEFPNRMGSIGIFSIVLGAYVLNISQQHRRLLAPLKALGKETGAKLILLVAFLWSITSNFDKIGVQNSSPIFWVIANYATISLLIFMFVVYQGKIDLTEFKKPSNTLVLIGLFNAIAVACQMSAIVLSLVAYVIAVKRTSAVFSVLWGHFVFQETEIRQRLLGSMIMIAGAIAIALS